MTVMDRPAVIVSVSDIEPERLEPSIKVEELIQNRDGRSSASEHDLGSNSGSAHVGTCKHCGHVVEIPDVAPHIG